MVVFFFQAEDGIRDLVRSRGLGDVYKRQHHRIAPGGLPDRFRCLAGAAGPRCDHAQGQRSRPAGSARRCLDLRRAGRGDRRPELDLFLRHCPCLLYTSDAADDLLCVDLGGRRIIKKKKTQIHTNTTTYITINIIIQNTQRTNPQEQR